MGKNSTGDIDFFCYLLIYLCLFAICSVLTIIIYFSPISINIAVDKQLIAVILTGSISLTSILLAVIGILVNIFRDQRHKTPGQKLFGELLTNTLLLFAYGSINILVSFVFFINGSTFLYVFSNLLFVSMIILLLYTVSNIVLSVFKRYMES